jgi:hypothetical protein
MSPQPSSSGVVICLKLEELVINPHETQEKYAIQSAMEVLASRA